MKAMPKPFTLIVCTYMRAEALLRLLNSVRGQTLYPNEILIIDGSTDDKTDSVLKENTFENLKYFKVAEQDRGLTRQRNFGVQKVSHTSEIICFLDDDVVLEKDFFKELISAYDKYSDAVAVGGYITNEVNWEREGGTKTKDNFYFDGWMRKESSRFRIRQFFGLQPDRSPGFMPTFSHGRSISFLPPSGKIYPIEMMMGGVASYKRKVFQTLKFSEYFEGYGLYEDLDFSFRVAKLGKIYVNTAARLGHYHEASGRPNAFKYGKMVVRNGWYVWRVKYPSPPFKNRLKWNLTVLLLTALRSTNIFNSPKKQEAFTECAGRFAGLLSLVVNKPKVE
ncbi:glycosyltransferase family 2 protein [Hyunsoonleella rubra]